MRKLLLSAVCLGFIFLSGCSDVYVIGEGQIPQDTATRKAVKPALLRLEDVGPGGPYESEENLHKLYAVTEYLRQEGVPYHVSLIPRVVVPKKGYDVSIADDTPYVRRFVSTIKYMQERGAIIGIHGYTHQSGSDPSAFGFEFYDLLDNPRVPNTYEFARERVDKAIDLFKKAGITPGYWETPHYTASIKQHPAFEEQTGLLYENKHRGEMVNYDKVYDYPGQGYRGFVTVPAPLGNIDRDGDVEKMIKKLDHMGNDLASFFYHPFREFRYLYKNYNPKGEVYYVYDQNSPLHVLIRAFKEKGYTFVTVNSLVRFVPAHRLDGLSFGEGDLALTLREDGRKKILIWNRSSNRCRIYEHTAAWHTPRRIKAFTEREAEIEIPAPEQDALLLAGDFNGSKRDDLLVFSPGQGTIRLMENRRDKFVPLARKSLGTYGLKSAYPLVGDFNGDGVTDVAVHDRENGRLGIALRNEGGGFKPIRWQRIDLLKGNSQQLLAGDFNGDRRDDIAVHNTVSGQWNVLLAGPGGKRFNPTDSWARRWGIGDSWVCFASDVNGDGRSDLILYNRTGHWQMAVSDGKGFVYSGDFGPWGSSPKGVPMVADLNGDGRSDFIILDDNKGKGYNLDVAQSVMGR